MFCIDNRCTDVYFNLAAEEYLLKKKKDNFFMMWQSVPSVVIGKHQSVRKEVDEKYIHENNILLARRFSGGGAVYHDEGNLNLSFMETVERPDFEYYLQQTVDFLESLGIVAYTDKRMGIYVDDRKVSGSAQCIHKNRVMYHCTCCIPPICKHWMPHCAEGATERTCCPVRVCCGPFLRYAVRWRISVSICCLPYL